MNIDNNPVYVMMVGLPGTGKSTFMREHFSGLGCHVFSSDLELEEIATSENMTYDEAFSRYISDATNVANAWLKCAIYDERNIIDDHTNTSSKKRKAKLDALPKHYTKVALVFRIPDEYEWNRRLDSRVGKTIPKKVLTSMDKTFSMPSKDEGFDFISVIQ